MNNTIIINNANKEQVIVLSKLAKLLNLNVTSHCQSPDPSKKAIDEAIEAYEIGNTKALKVSIKDFKEMVNALNQNN